MFGGIRWRLTAWYVGILFLILAAVGVLAYAMLSRALTSEVDRALETSASNIAAQLGDARALPPVPGASSEARDEEDEDEHEDEEEHEGDDEIHFFSPESGDVFYLILAPDGTTVLNPLNVHVAGLPDQDAAREAAASGTAWRTARTEGADYRLYSVAVLDRGRPAAVVQVGRSLEEHERQLRSLLLVLGLSGMGGLLLATAGGLVVAGRALVPVRRAFERQRAFVADASHELRTPLTLVRANGEVLQRGADRLTEEDREAVADIVRETEHMARLVSDLLTLARLDEGRLPMEAEPVDMAELVGDVARQGQVMAGDRLTVEANVPHPLPVRGDRTRLREALLALVDNAIRYTPEGGRVQVDGRISSGKVQVVVQDTGPGIAQEDLPHIFERFYRADKARSRAHGGTGLGLSIARGIVEAHGGSLTASSAPGAGAAFTMVLPARQ